MRPMMMSAAVAMLAAGAAGAATVTFDELPDEGAQLTSWSEDGILVTGQGGVVASLNPGTAQVDDSGTGFASSLAFSTEGLFAATSLEILPLANFYELCMDAGEGEVDCTPARFADVSVTGYADGNVVASDAFDVFGVNGAYSFGDAFTSLDLLVIGFADLPTDLRSGSFLACDDSPCRRFSVDSVTLVPAVVPLPASGALLAFGIAGLAAAYRRRR